MRPLSSREARSHPPLSNQFPKRPAMADRNAEWFHMLNADVLIALFKKRHPEMLAHVAPTLEGFAGPPGRRLLSPLTRTKLERVARSKKSDATYGPAPGRASRASSPSAGGASQAPAAVFSVKCTTLKLSGMCES